MSVKYQAFAKRTRYATMLRGAMIAPNALVKQSTMQQLSSAQQPNDRIFFWVCSLQFSELSSSNKSQYEIGKNLRRCIIGLCVGFGILLSCLGGMLLIRRWKRDIQRKLRRKYFTKNQGLLLEQLISSDENASSKTKIFFSRRAQKGYKWLWYITYTWTWRPWNGLQRYLVRSACSSNKNFKDHGVRWNW